MSGQFELDLNAVAPEAVAGVRVLGVVHGRVESAAVARCVLEAYQPTAIAVELPKSLAPAVDRAIERLPEISFLLSEPADRLPLAWAVAPGDPFVEALRWANERGRERFFVDPDVVYDDEHDDPIPDPYALVDVGPMEYVSRLCDALAETPATESDEVRERGMAHHCRKALAQLRSAAEEGADASGETRLLVLVGAAHAQRLGPYLDEASAEPFVRPRGLSTTELLNVHPESLTGLLPDSPLSHAVWERIRSGERVTPVPIEDTLRRRESVVKAGLRLITGGAADDEAVRHKNLVERAALEASRPWSAGTRIVDRRALERLVWKVAKGSYEALTDEAVQPWQEKLFFEYSRRLARVSGELASGLYGWVVSGRGVLDDNLAWELFAAARTYPWQKTTSDLATARIDGSELDLGTKRIRFRRRFRRVKKRLTRVPVTRREPGDIDEWLRGFDGEMLCSFPPEDLVIEDFGRFLQRKAVSVLSSERSRTEPFSTSLLDGIDLRETLAHIHEDRVYVREVGRSPGRAGSVVVIFDDDDEDVRFPYKMTWLGENDQESDMAFYATVPGDHVVGPGILRSTYGGLMLTTPRGRLSEVWDDPDYLVRARSKPEVLLLAAIDYSTEMLIVHVADRPPRERIRRYAALQAKRIVHLPLGVLSPVTLKKIRVLHILSGHDKRKIAKDYIW